MKTRSSKILVLFVLLALFFLNYPWLSLFSVGQLSMGIPVFYLYLFGFWLLIIIVISLLTEARADSPPRPMDTDGIGKNDA